MFVHHFPHTGSYERHQVYGKEQAIANSFKQAAIAEDQGFEYELQALGFNAAVQALEAGQADGVIAGMSITDERKEKFDFSEAYFDSGVVMGIAADNEEVKSYADLAGKTVAVKIGTEGQTFAESIKDEYGIALFLRSVLLTPLNVKASSTFDNAV